MNRYAVVFEESAQAEDHAVEVQLTAASEGKVFRRVRECFRVRRIFQRRHEDKQCG